MEQFQTSIQDVALVVDNLKVDTIGDQVVESLEKVDKVQRKSVKTSRRSILFQLKMFFFCLYVFVFEELPARVLYSIRPLSQAGSLLKEYALKHSLTVEMSCGVDVPTQSKAIREAIGKGTYSEVAGKEDAWLFCKILNDAYLERYGLPRLSTEEFRQKIDEGHVPCFVLCSGKRVGTFLFEIDGSGYAEFACLSIEKRWRGRGLMSKVFDELAASIFVGKLALGIFFDCVPLQGTIYMRVLSRRWVCRKIHGVRMANPKNDREILLLFGVWPVVPKQESNHGDGKEPDMTNLLEATLTDKVGIKSKSSKVCVVAFFLGMMFALALALLKSPMYWNLAVYMALSVLWHLSEFFFEDSYNPTRSSVSSFCLDSKAYIIGTTIMMVEYFIESKLLIPSGWRAFFVYVGECGLLASLLLQILSKITLGNSFTYFVADAKEKKDQKLTTHGLYAYSRHPRYAAFVVWVLCTNIVLLNPLNAILQMRMIIKFYGKRIENEEKELTKAYGQEYLDYKAKTPTLIPFIK